MKINDHNRKYSIVESLIGVKMRLEQVEISNFKGIEECTIELNKGFNLLIGDNGKLLY